MTSAALICPSCEWTLSGGIPEQRCPHCGDSMVYDEQICDAADLSLQAELDRLEATDPAVAAAAASYDQMVAAITRHRHAFVPVCRVCSAAADHPVHLADGGSESAAAGPNPTVQTEPAAPHAFEPDTCWPPACGWPGCGLSRDEQVHQVMCLVEYGPPVGSESELTVCTNLRPCWIHAAPGPHRTRESDR